MKLLKVAVVKIPLTSQDFEVFDIPKEFAKRNNNKYEVVGEPNYTVNGSCLIVTVPVKEQR